MLRQDPARRARRLRRRPAGAADERARLVGPLNGIVGTPNDYTWSADNSAEVDNGWITRADTPEALAEAIGTPELPRTLREYGALPDEFGRVDPTPLEPPLHGGGLGDALVFGRIAGTSCLENP